MNSDPTTRENSSQKILAAAIEEFTKYGYEGARVARIAKNAGVSQALIYYNFSSKQALMDEILNQFFNSNIKYFSDALPATQDASPNDLHLKDELRKSLKFILENHQEVKILLMQTLLESQGDKRILTMLNDLNAVIRTKALTEFGYTLSDDDKEKRAVIDYFMIFIPFIMFGLLGKEWSQVNNISIDEAVNALIEVTDGVYNSYLK